MSDKEIELLRQDVREGNKETSTAITSLSGKLTELVILVARGQEQMNLSNSRFERLDEEHQKMSEEIKAGASAIAEINGIVREIKNHYQFREESMESTLLLRFAAIQKDLDLVNKDTSSLKAYQNTQRATFIGRIWDVSSKLFIGIAIAIILYKTGWK